MLENMDHLQLRLSTVSKRLAMNRSLRCLSLCGAGIKDYFIAQVHCCYSLPLIPSFHKCAFVVQLVEVLPNTVGLTQLMLGKNMIEVTISATLTLFL